MKKAMLGFGFLFLAAPVFAAEVLSAKLDANKENILVDVRYGGGCKEHKFELKLHGCAESMPVQCRADLVDSTNDDFCEAIITTTATFNLAQLGLNTGYYSRASLAIKGSGGAAATVRLPEFGGVRSELGQIRCKTHTGSDLQITSVVKTVRLQTADGQVSAYAITNVSEMSLESNPPIAQSKFSLSDGRKIVTEFMGDSKSGRGYFIRVDGSASPEFTCQR